MNKLKISEMTGKLKMIPAVNTSPLSNDFCKAQGKVKGSICSKCYSVNACNGYRSMAVPVWERNSQILKDLIPFDELPTINNVFFRFNAHGELINSPHFINLCNIAKKNPRTMFALWTKRSQIVQKNLQHVPKNLILIYSRSKIDCRDKRIPKGFHKVFNVVSRGEHNCGARSCWTCAKCYNFNKSVVITEKVK